MKRFAVVGIVGFILITLFLTGCTRIAFYKRTKQDVAKIEQLDRELAELRRQRELESQRFAQAQRTLEEKLQQEIANKQVSLDLERRGLVIKIVEEVLFDSGKAELKSQTQDVLEKIAKVIRSELSDKNIGVEGHTDNQPIKYSGWKSNWELSNARALSVLHYLVEKGNISSNRLSATGYGEYRPVATNMTKEGRRKNRRVEIVVLPYELTKAELKSLGRTEGNEEIRQQQPSFK